MRYYSFNKYLRDRFHVKVRKLGLNAGFLCPNKDQETGSGGCIFCNEQGFSQFAGKDIALNEQIESSMPSFKERYGTLKFMAYFQNAANTNAPLEELRSTYDIIKK